MQPKIEEIQALKEENRLLKQQLGTVISAWKQLTQFHEDTLTHFHASDYKHAGDYRSLLSKLYDVSGNNVVKLNGKEDPDYNRPWAVLVLPKIKDNEYYSGKVHVFNNESEPVSEKITIELHIDKLLSRNKTNIDINHNLSQNVNKDLDIQDTINAELSKILGDRISIPKLSQRIIYRCGYGEKGKVVIGLYDSPKTIGEFEVLSIKNCALTMESLYEFFHQIKDLQSTSLEMISRIELLARKKDPETTGNHVIRMSAYSSVIAHELSKDEKFKDICTHNFVESIGHMAALHDIGKVGIPDKILNKPGTLTMDEFAIMKLHTSIGGTCLEGSKHLKMAWEIAMFHHERFDGSGYPIGLKGEDIPISARIVAVADVYDALTTERPYKQEYDHKSSVETMLQGKGAQFDPDVFDAFLRVESRILEIKERFKEVGSIPENHVIMDNIIEKPTG